MEKWPRRLGRHPTSGLPGYLQKPLRSWLRWRAVNENVEVGHSLRVGRGVVISAPHSMTIGSNVSIGPWSILQCDGEIGDFALLGMHVYVAGRHDHDYQQPGVPIVRSTWSGQRLQLDDDVVTIGTDVWIGGRSLIMSGVTVGLGAVVGAGSVVTRSVAPFQIVAGSPARAIGERFRNDSDVAIHCEKLAEIGARIVGA